jgi:hypothetical protein
MQLDAPLSVPAISCPEIELKIASTREEWEAAFELLYRSYRRAGLCAENSCGFRATKYQLLPTTDIFIAKLEGEVISTVSLVRDSEFGLPMEDVYREEVAERRAAGLRLAEVSCLADRRRDAYRFFGLFCELSRLMAQLAIKLGIDELVIAVHPRHASLYRRYMAFRRFGERRVYPTVQNHPAVALVLNFAQAQAERPAGWKKFFGPQLSDNVLQSCPMAQTDREFFRTYLQAEAGTAHDRPSTAWEDHVGQNQPLEPCAWQPRFLAAPDLALR